MLLKQLYVASHIAATYLFQHFTFSPFSSLQSCHLFLSLVPFFSSAGIFFFLLNPDSRSSVWFAVVKSAPVLLLAAVVLSWNRGQSFLGVVLGLVFSAVGDWCLVWKEHFLLGRFPVLVDDAKKEKKNLVCAFD